MALSYKIYQSRALIPDDVSAHNNILGACVKHNSAAGVTGFLHREGAWFLQYLEGPTDALEKTMQRINADPRHEDITQICSGPVVRRMFPDWQMGFVSQRQMALRDLLEADEEGLGLLVEDPFDIVVFLSTNADLLRGEIAA